MSIVVEDYHKSYGSFVAVRGLSFRVESGEVLGLVGPNGAGKTTTLRALAGILRPTRGRMIIDGHDLVARSGRGQAGDRVYSRRAQAVRSAHRVGASAVRRLRLRPARLDRAGGIAAGAVRAGLQAPARAGELSRGMRQKAAICCGYLHRPRAVLLDEPMTGLDPRGIRTMKDSILEQRGPERLSSSARTCSRWSRVCARAC